jgi:hypothetical protein
VTFNVSNESSKNAMCVSTPVPDSLGASPGQIGSFLASVASTEAPPTAGRGAFSSPEGQIFPSAGASSTQRRARLASRLRGGRGILLSCNPPSIAVASFGQTPRALGGRPEPRRLRQNKGHFSWASARQLFDGLPGGRGLDIAHEAVDRHAAGANAGRVAFRWIGRSGESRNITYADPLGT